MAEKEETTTVAVRLPLSQAVQLRAVAEASSLRLSDVLRHVIAEWVAENA